VHLLSPWLSWLCNVYTRGRREAGGARIGPGFAGEYPQTTALDAATSPVVQRKKVLPEEVANRERSVSEVVVLLGKVATITGIIGPLPTPE